MLKGIDISQYQPKIDYDTLKSQIDFVIIRSSYGVGYIDKYFALHRDNVRSRGILCGFYHYSYPQYNQPEAEADWFLQTVGTPQDGEILCLDFEENWSGDKVDWCKRFLDRLASRLGGYKGLIYLNQNLIIHNNWTNVINAGYGLWVASYDNNPDSIRFAIPWNQALIKQYTDAGIVTGINGRVDMDSFFGDQILFKSVGYQSMQPLPIPQSPVLPSSVQPIPFDNGQVNNPETVPPVNPDINTTNPTFSDSLKSRKFILSIGASILAFVNSKFNLGLTMNDLAIIFIPILAFIIMEGLADIIGRSKKS